MNQQVKDALVEFTTSMIGFAGMVALLYYFRDWTVPAFLWALEKAHAIAGVF